MKDSVRELFLVDGLCEEDLDSILHYGHGQHFVNVRPIPLIRIEQLSHDRLHLGREAGGQRVESTSHDFHSEEVETRGVEGRLRSA